MIASPMTAANMRVVEIEGGKGPASALRTIEGPTPQPGPGQILIKVAAAGVNRPDLLQRLGHYPPPPGAPLTLGLEAAGVVAAVGAGVERWTAGDQVTALLGGGGYAQYALADARSALPIPRGLSLLEAAALPETIFTVYVNLFEHGGLRAGQSVLIHGATSGIGVTAIQTAKAAGARVFATGRGADKARQALALGADLAVDSSQEDFVAAVTAAGGADLILDMVGGDYFARNIACLNTGGRLVHIAFQAGARVEADLSQIMRRRLVVTGSTLRPRDEAEKGRIADAVEANLWPWIEAGRIRPIIDKTFALDQAAEAHAYLEAGSHVGKVMLIP